MITVNHISTTQNLKPVKNVQDSALVDLLKGCANEDRSSQEILFKRYYGLLLAVCLRYYKNKDDAKAILNQAFLKIFKKINLYRFEGSFEGWISRLTVNTILDDLRKKKIDYDDYETHQFALSQNDSILPKLYYDDLLGLLNQLPKTTKIVFNLFSIEGYKHQEIATLLKISVGTSKWHVSEAKKKLRLLINELYGHK